MSRCLRRPAGLAAGRACCCLRSLRDQPHPTMQENAAGGKVPVGQGCVHPGRVRPVRALTGRSCRCIYPWDPRVLAVTTFLILLVPRSSQAARAMPKGLQHVYTSQSEG